MNLTQKFRPNLLPLSIGALTLIFLIYYLSPLVNYQNNLVGALGDVYSHAAFTEWHCDNFFSYNFQNQNLFYPHGVNLSRGYTMPLLISLACPLRNLGGVAMLNFIAALQIILIFISSALVAKKYLQSNWVRLSFIFLYSFSAFVLTRLKEHINLLSTVWGVALIFYFFEGLDLNNRKKVIIAFVAFGLAATSAWQNIANLTFLSIVLLAGSLIRHKNRLKSSLINITIGLLVSFLVTLPLTAPLISGNLTKVSTQNAELLSFTSLASFVTPWENHLFHNLIPDDWYVPREAVAGIDPAIWLLLIAFTITYFVTKKHYLSRVYIGLLVLYAILPSGQQLTTPWFKLSLGYFSSLYRFFPLSTTRSPARLGIVFIFLLILAVHIWLEKSLKNSRPIRRIAFISLAIYAVITTTILSQNLQINVIDYSPSLPAQGLSIMAKNPDSAVLAIPVIDDQTKNFLQMFHQKPLLSGYVSYAVREPTTQRHLTQSPFLKYFDCQSSAYAFNPQTDKADNQNAFVNLLIDHLSHYQVRYIIFNTWYLNTHDRCQNLRDIVNTVHKSSKITLLDKSSWYQIYTINSQKPSLDQTFLSYEISGFNTGEGKLNMQGQSQPLYFITNNNHPKSIRFTASPADNQIPTQIIISGGGHQVTYAIKKPTQINFHQSASLGLNTITLETNQCVHSKACTSLIISHLDISDEDP